MYDDKPSSAVRVLASAKAIRELLQDLQIEGEITLDETARN